MEIPDHMESSAHHRNALALWSWGVSKGRLERVFGYQILFPSSCKELLILILFLVNKIIGKYIINLCLPFILPFMSFVGHFIHHPHVLLEINLSIITTCTTMLMPEVCRVHSIIDCDWVPLSGEDDVPGFK